MCKCLYVHLIGYIIYFNSTTVNFVYLTFTQIEMIEYY